MKTVAAGVARTSVASPPDALPARVGIGLKQEHAAEVAASHCPVGFFEVHAENYMVAGGPVHARLERIRRDYPLSLHGVGLSIGGESAPDRAHLERLAALVRRYEPACFSEHLAWSGHGTTYLNDLLPIPYTVETLARVCSHVDEVQELLGMRMLLENPSTYVLFAESTMPEPAFISEVIRRTGCALLLDLTNAHVTCTNHGLDSSDYLRGLPLDAVGEVHLAGFATQRDAAGDPLLIDDHASPVAAVVRTLYRDLVGALGPVPTLIERDNDIPPLDVLVAEAAAIEHEMPALRRHGRGTAA